MCACVCSSLPTLAVAAGIGLALSTEPSTFVNVMLLSPVNLYVASRVRVLLRERVTQRAIIDASWKPSLIPFDGCGEHDRLLTLVVFAFFRFSTPLATRISQHPAVQLAVVLCLALGAWFIGAVALLLCRSWLLERAKWGALFGSIVCGVFAAVVGLVLRIPAPPSTSKVRAITSHPTNHPTTFYWVRFVLNSCLRTHIHTHSLQTKWWMIPMRGMLGASIIALAIGLGMLNPLVGGILSVFPAIGLVSISSVWVSSGAAVAMGAAGPMMLGNMSIAAFFVLYAIMYEPFGIWIGCAVAWCTAVACVSVPVFLALRWLASRAQAAEPKDATPQVSDEGASQQQHERDEEDVIEIEMQPTGEPVSPGTASSERFLVDGDDSLSRSDLLQTPDIDRSDTSTPDISRTISALGLTEYRNSPALSEPFE